jgi:transposase
MEQITTVGIDLAKNVFSLHAVDVAGKPVLRRTVRRERLVETVAALPPCLIGMEACSGAHEWGRRFERYGHTVKLMAPKFVAPYRKSGKNDGNDAEAVCEAVSRPSMRFVPVKSAEQQALLAMHRVRYGFVVERTAVINRLRGLMAEFGVVLPLGSVTVRREAAAAAEILPELARRAVADLLEQLRLLDGRIEGYDREIEAQARLCAPARRLMQIAVSVPPPRSPSLLPSAMRVSSRTAGSSLPGSASCRINTRAAANRVLATSASGVMPTFATCSCKARARCFRPRPDTTIGSHAGR